MYGNYDMVPDKRGSKVLANHQDQLGSMGKPGDSETSGGGRVVLLAESIVLQGFGSPIQANAKPFETVSNTPY